MRKQRLSIPSALATVLLAAFLGGCGDSPESLIASSREFLAKNDNKAAVIQLKNALQQNPNLGEARFLLGKTLLDIGDTRGAEVELRKAHDLKYSPEQTIPLLSKAMLGAGQAKKVIEEFGKTDSLSGESLASLKTTLSVAFLVQGNRDAAQSALSDALKAQPDFAPALLSLARNKVANRDLEGAQALVAQVLEKNPKNHDALLLNGSLQGVKSGTEAALNDYRKAIEAKPDFIAGHAAVITTLFQQQKFDEASTQIDALKKIAPKHPQTLYLDAQGSYQRKDFQGARSKLQDLLKFNPNNPTALQLAGAVEFQLRSYLQAETYLNKALAQAPELRLARRTLVSTYLRNGQAVKALNTLQPMLDKTENDTALLTLAGETYLQNGDPKKAEEYFAKASKLDPNDPGKKTSIALTHLVQGDVTGAVEDLEQIAQSDKGFRADLALIATFIQTNQPDKALKAIDSLEKKQPDNPSTHNLRAQTLLQKKDLVGARASYEAALKINPAFFPAAAGLAKIDLSEKKPDEAKKRFENVLAANPKSAPALLALAELKAATKGTPEEVAGLIGKAITSNPTEVTPRLALIQYYLSQKDTKKALGAANDAAAAIQDKPEIIEALGRTQQIAGDLNQALASYTKLATLQPASPVPLLRIAEAHIANKNKDEAGKTLKKALDIKSDLIEAQRGLILLALDAKKPNEALQIALQIEKQRPKESAGFVLEGDIHATSKNWNDSANAYRNALKRAPSSEVAVKLHSVLMASGNTQEATRMASTWQKEHPKDITLLIHQGDVASSRKDYPLGAKYYQQALEIQPNNALVLNNLAWVSGELKAPKAMEYAEKANQLAPGQPQFMDTLAMLLAQKGETKKAIDLLRKALSTAPNASLIQLNLAKVLISAGEKQEARKELEALEKLGDKFPSQSEVTKLLQAL